jgi:hypothetical protein
LDSQEMVEGCCFCALEAMVFFIKNFCV